MTYPQPPQPAFYPPAPAPAKRRKWPWIAGGAGVFVLLLCGIGAISAASGGGTESPNETIAAAETSVAPKAAGTTAPKKTAPKTPGIGVPAKDGDFQFTVTGVKCGVAKVGNQYFGEKAQGQFCLVSVQVKNIGKEAQTLIDSVQKAFDAQGTEYSVDSGAAIYANGDQQVFFEDVNPGNTVRGKLVFDVPKGTKLTTVELHDSLFSGGVKVALK
ncbi:DUF4352 domain-containing protein [Actinoplanes sp. LDG1-06]|uniref:DUF4352 domain-containing protein n=1 Tax=Paractinoplanes ovalisporus TaxID=2810368 RepID=A0ABS2AMQ1_9ACTN|nr:DUF4352 domain-containing protein [Actinoplanes ovalisporus]MBM2621061.1 DUF4352 domain-containing protein [Actinoplanes ovalisporus]